MQQLEQLVRISSSVAIELEQLRVKNDERRKIYREEWLAVENRLVAARHTLATYLVDQIGASEARELGEILIGGPIKMQCDTAA